MIFPVLINKAVCMYICVCVFMYVCMYCHESGVCMTNKTGFGLS
jgi:hypothetical protein